MRQLKEFLDKLKRFSLDVDYYPHCILGWMQGRGRQEVRYLGRENLPSLDAFLQHYLNRSVPDGETSDVDDVNAQLERFYQEFQRLYKVRCYELYATDRVKLEKLLGIRKGKTQRKATINKSLAALNLPYEIKKHKNCWILCQKSP